MEHERKSSNLSFKSPVLHFPIQTPCISFTGPKGTVHKSEPRHLLRRFFFLWMSFLFHELLPLKIIAVLQVPTYVNLFSCLFILQIASTVYTELTEDMWSLPPFCTKINLIDLQIRQIWVCNLAQQHLPCHQAGQLKFCRLFLNSLHLSQGCCKDRTNSLKLLIKVFWNFQQCITAIAHSVVTPYLFLFL